MKKILSFAVSIFATSLLLGNNNHSHHIEKPRKGFSIDLGACEHTTMNSKKLLRYEDSRVDFSNWLDSVILPTRSSSTDYVYTPNGTSVSVLIRDEVSQQDIEMANEYGDNLVPEATRIAPSTVKYNCHSFAWYMQSSSNPYWMNYPQSYYTDGSYETSTGNEGDIICYFDEYGQNLHSGIVTSRLSGVSNGVCGDSNLVMVRSKWGGLGLYDHRGDQCPYTSSYNGQATYVQYFKPRTIDSVALTNPTSNSTENIHKYYSVPINSTIMNNYALYQLNVLDSKYYSFEISSAYELDVKLYRKYMQPVSINATSIYENETYKVSFNHIFSYENYYLRVAFANNSNYGTIHTEIINTHSHSYNHSYVWRNYTTHRSTCSCGASHFEGHAISSGSIVIGEQYATCLFCGGPASTGFVPLSSFDLFPRSINGSFILPNGVVVLVEDDFDAYLNGTLLFVEPNIS